MTSSNLAHRAGASWLVAVITHAGRLLRRWRRSVPTMISILAMPVMMLVIMKVVFAGMIEQFIRRDMDMTGVSVMVCVSMMFTGAITGAGSTVQERREGIPDRIATLPGHRSTGFVGRILAETIRAGLSGLVAISTGSILGADFGSPDSLGVVMLILTGVAFSAGIFAVMMGYLAQTPQGAVSFAPLIMAAMFFNTSMMPRELYAEALRPVVDVSPITAVAQVVTDALDSTWHAGHLLLFVAWFGGIALLSGLVLWRKTSSRRR